MYPWLRQIYELLPASCFIVCKNCVHIRDERDNHSSTLSADRSFKVALYTSGLIPILLEHSLLVHSHSTVAKQWPLNFLLNFMKKDPSCLEPNLMGRVSGPDVTADLCT